MYLTRAQVGAPLQFGNYGVFVEIMVLIIFWNSLKILYINALQVQVVKNALQNEFTSGITHS